MLGSKLLLMSEVACGNVIGLDHELAPEQVMSPSMKTMHYHGHIFFMHCLPPLSVIKLPTFKGDKITILY